MHAKPREAFIDLYYEDVVLGDEVATDEHFVTKEGILAFAEVTRDRHPLHTDEEFCKNTRYGKVIAHGLFGLSLIEGLKSELQLYQNTSIASLGWDKVRFRKPIFAGDTVHVNVSFISKRESNSSPHGIVVERVEMVNQDGEVVIGGEHATLLYTRHSAPTAAA